MRTEILGDRKMGMRQREMKIVDQKKDGDRKEGDGEKEKMAWKLKKGVEDKELDRVGTEDREMMDGEG